MIRVNEKRKYFDLFESYSHNRAVIFSSLEGQYDGELYVDSEKSPQFAVLFTPFDFHFVGGNSAAENVVDEIDKLIFHQYLKERELNEAIVFSPDEKWNKVLDEVFSKHGGIKDNRKIYRLNKDKFVSMQAGIGEIDGLNREIVYEQKNGSHIEYPVCRIMDHDHCISYCSGFMLGKGHAEIDVYTEESHRGKGYAKAVSIMLINELLKKEIEPDWCTWPYRKESQQLALSLGYELHMDVPAHIWVK